jgi:hypothetical protein
MTEEIQAWITIIAPSILTGLLLANFIKGRIGIILSGLIPWLGLLMALLYQEYFIPYQGGGASMWPIVQFFGGTVAAITGVTAYLFGSKLFGKNVK